MKLATFLTAAGVTRFGAVRDDRVVAFTDLAPRARGLGSVEKYLAGLPATFQRALDLLEAHPGARGTPVSQVRFLPAVPRPAALLDCALSPRHLRSSTEVLLRHALPWRLGRLLGPVAGSLVGRPRTGVRYYKGNHHSIIGDQDTIAWPDYTAYLDIEPELALVTGAAQELAGYLIYNDASARDVQLPEMFFTGPTSSKDFDDGNGLGPFLVTPDEVPEPLGLATTVDFPGRPTWRGSTAEYTHHPTEVLTQIAARRTLPAGTVIGMGTVPGCCGLDRDEWLTPGEQVTIRIDRLGTLRQYVGTPAGTPSTRWSPRTSLGC
ncbi:fumarylacetoacetate hydrolase family protein [Amycolatopsis cihanbeyliensis]|uniref:Fumarylacetoacetase-like protein n=1 Tax=Amycolatopsis cihanbeyliensis TaxID=1128664 RepID=A0A542DD41_AMYCI|nr:fumarylacetoacetate hydrolase family protein [Amycolatopsis cihanbeyliensis]TQJ00976.1 fumarylacetoacetase-like protein [Amycolatopsis cihanbeyliensis]